MFHKVALGLIIILLILFIYWYMYANSATYCISNQAANSANAATAAMAAANATAAANLAASNAAVAQSAAQNAAAMAPTSQSFTPHQWKAIWGKKQGYRPQSHRYDGTQYSAYGQYGVA
jgi:hypothetical protein